MCVCVCVCVDLLYCSDISGTEAAVQLMRNCTDVAGVVADLEGAAPAAQLLLQLPHMSRTARLRSVGLAGAPPPSLGSSG